MQGIAKWTEMINALFIRKPETGSASKSDLMKEKLYHEQQNYGEGQSSV